MTSDVPPRAFGRDRISQPPRASPSRVPGPSVASDRVQLSRHPQTPCAVQGRAREAVDAGPACPLTRFVALGPVLSCSVDESTLARARIRTPRGAGRLSEPQARASAALTRPQERPWGLPAIDVSPP